jgi:hypothetical protein
LDAFADSPQDHPYFFMGAAGLPITAKPAAGERCCRRAISAREWAPALLYETLPPGTLRVRGDAICALISGMSYDVCFDLDRTDAKSFRGSLAANSLVSCQFTKRPSQAGMIRPSLPLSKQSTVTPSSRR